MTALSLGGRIGAQFLYRLGRKMYMSARRDIPNDMRANGEQLLQRAAILARRQQELVVFDVGANVGDWTQQFLQELRTNPPPPRLALYAFEPVPTTMQVLKQNLPSDLPGLFLEDLALSGASGIAHIHVTDHSGINSLHSMDGHVTREVPIRTITASDFITERGLAHVHLMKCDTEGHDMEVMRGALPLLREGRISILQFEYNYRWVYSRNFLHDVFQLIEGLPYRLAKLQPDRLLLLKAWHPELERFFECNYALVHRDALSWMRTEEVKFDRFNALVTA